MEETVRDSSSLDGWRDALAQTIEQQRRKVGQRIAGQRERLRELEGKIAQHLGEATHDLQTKQDAARDAAAKFQAEEAAAKQRAADLARREQELTKREHDLAALAAKAGTTTTGKPDPGAKQLLDDLSKRLTELEQRQNKLAEEERRLAARQQELSLREVELNQVQAGLSRQSETHQSRTDELAREEADLEKARQAHQAEVQRHQQQQGEVRRLESELKLKQQSLTERERETLRQRRHIAQQLRSRKKELTADAELQRSQTLASGAGEEMQLKMRLSELQGKYDRLQEELDQREQQRDEATRKLAEVKAQLDARQHEVRQHQLALEQAQRKQGESEVEKQRIQKDLQRHLEEAGRQAEAARQDVARRTTEAQAQAAEITRLAGELDRVRREANDQIERLRADHGKSHDSQIQSLHSQLDELRKKVLAEQSAWDTQRKQLETQLKAAEQKASQAGAAKGPDPAKEKELARLRDEHKLLEARLAEAEAKAKQGGGGGGGAELEDLRRRFEMAVQDVRELKTKNADLADQLSKARAAGGSAPAAGGATDWETMKKRMMQQMEEGFDDSDEKQKADKLTIEGAMKITDEVVAEKDKEIQELRRALDSQAQSVGEVAVGAAAIAQMLDNDELVKQERETLHKLQESLREQLKKAEIDISLERAKLARERAELDEKLRTIEAERPAPGAAPEEKGKKGSGRKWLTRLGLGDKG
jgi:chromosome segregation ATPase